MEQINSGDFAWALHQQINRGDEDTDGHEHTIARTKIHDVADYVLGDFDKSQQTELKHLLNMGSESLEVALESGIGTAQNRFNTK